MANRSKFERAAKLARDRKAARRQIQKRYEEAEGKRHAYERFEKRQARIELREGMLGTIFA